LYDTLRVVDWKQRGQIACLKNIIREKSTSNMSVFESSKFSKRMVDLFSGSRENNQNKATCNKIQKY
jgi:hypothetical protein